MENFGNLDYSSMLVLYARKNIINGIFASLKQTKKRIIYLFLFEYYKNWVYLLKIPF
jgi:hypothetical protein